MTAIITREVAKVYRGGGRRWFTVKAAANAEAWKRVNAKHCGCEPGDGSNYPGYTCAMHRTGGEAARVRNLVARYSRLLIRSFRTASLENSASAPLSRSTRGESTE